MIRYEEVKMSQGGVKLLGMIQRIMCGVEYYLQDTWALDKADKMLHTFWQKPNVN